MTLKKDRHLEVFMRGSERIDSSMSEVRVEKTAGGVVVVVVVEEMMASVIFR